MSARHSLSSATRCTYCPTSTLVGLPDTEVKEARDRVRAAIQNCRFDFPQRRITVNLAPADLPKESGRFDLPIALGILIASGQIADKGLDGYEFAGELALGGELRGIRGALAMCLSAANSQRAFVLPAESAAEAALVRSATILPARTLLDVCAHLNGQQALEPYRGAALVAAPQYPDLAEVKGQAQAKRALEVAACGGHSLLILCSIEPLTRALGIPLFRPARRGQIDAGQPLPGHPACYERGGSAGERRAAIPGWLLPDGELGPASISGAASLGVGRGAGQRRRCAAPGRDLARPPWRTLPGRTAGVRAAGAGSPQGTAGERPHRHFTSHATQRLSGAFPARRGDESLPLWLARHRSGRCRCSPDQVARYRGKLSGPLLDRIDLMIEVPALSGGELQAKEDNEPSSAVRARVIAARERQLERQGKANAALGTKEIETHCEADKRGLDLLKQAIARFNLSGRAYHRVLKVARSIADLAAAPGILSAHVAEAIQYRRGLSDG